MAELRNDTPKQSETFSEAQAASPLLLLSNEEMADVDRSAWEQGISGAWLMENAGRAVAEAITERFSIRPVAILCGPGNNGGDGFVIARSLLEQGWPVRLALLGQADKLSGDAKHHAGLWNGETEALKEGILDGAELVVDALFGAGLSRPLAGSTAEIVEAVNRSSAVVCAVDVPSGLSGNSGQPLGEQVIQANLTVTFCRQKPGHLLYPGRALCGETVLAQIGIPDSLVDQANARCWRNHPDLWRATLPIRGPLSHKYHFGHGLIATGPEMVGASILAGRAALRSGIGLLTLACSERGYPVLAGAMPSAMARIAEDSIEFDRLLDDPRRNAVLLGPGAGLGDQTGQRLNRLLADQRPLVLDADALTVLAQRGPLGPGLLPDICVLTPHDGEFQRLFPDLQGDRLTKARSAAARSGAVVISKGADSVIAAPDGRAIINDNAPPSLAVGGAGDVLSGVVLAFLAQGLPAFEAAAAAVWCHGEAARLIGGPLIAEDLTAKLSAAMTAAGQS